MGIGIDIVFIPRFVRVLEYTPAVLDQILHPNEMESNVDITFVAGRFAAKEAILKCGLAWLNILKFNQIDIGRIEGSKSKFLLNGMQYIVDISISHDCEYVVAVASNLQAIRDK